MLKDELIKFLMHDSSCIVLRNDCSNFGSRTQVTTVFRDLVASGVLCRLGAGVYEKKTTCEKSGEERDLDLYICVLVREVFHKLGAEVENVNVSLVSGKKLCVVDTGGQRISRKLKIHGVPVHYVRESFAECSAAQYVYWLPNDVEELPVKNVRSYIEGFAAAHHVKYKRTGLDDFAESVTRLAGDEIELDSTEKLLVALKRKDLINGRQLARLMSNYTKEVKNVRSVRGLCDGRLSTQR